MLLVIIIGILLPPSPHGVASETQACSCLAITRKEAICESQWISLVNVLNNSESRDDKRLIEYAVEHVKVFKKVFKLQSSADNELQDKVMTPKSAASCGVTGLKRERQYLLAGSVIEGRGLFIFSCGAIPAQDGSFNPSPGVLEWDRVPIKLRNALLSQEFPNCTSSS